MRFLTLTLSLLYINAALAINPDADPEQAFQVARRAGILKVQSASGSQAYARGQVRNGIIGVFQLTPPQMRQVVEQMQVGSQPLALANPGLSSYPIVVMAAAQHHVGAINVSRDEMIQAASFAQPHLQHMVGRRGLDFVEQEIETIRRDLWTLDLEPYHEFVIYVPGLKYRGAEINGLYKVLASSEQGVKTDRANIGFPMFYVPEKDITLSTNAAEVLKGGGWQQRVELFKAQFKPVEGAEYFKLLMPGRQSSDIQSLMGEMLPSLANYPMVAQAPESPKPKYFSVQFDTQTPHFEFDIVKGSFSLHPSALGLKGTEPLQSNGYGLRITRGDWFFLRSDRIEELVTDPTFLRLSSPPPPAFPESRFPVLPALETEGAFPKRTKKAVVLGMGLVGGGVVQDLSENGWKVSVVGRTPLKELPKAAQDLIESHEIEYLSMDAYNPSQDDKTLLESRLREASLAVNAAEKAPLDPKEAPDWKWVEPKPKQSIHEEADRLMSLLLDAGFNQDGKLFVRIGSPVEYSFDLANGRPKDPYADMLMKLPYTRAKLLYSQATETARGKGLRALTMTPAAVIGGFLKPSEGTPIEGLIGKGDGTIIDLPLDVVTAEKVGEAIRKLFTTYEAGGASELPREPVPLGWPSSTGELATAAAYARSRITQEPFSPPHVIASPFNRKTRKQMLLKRSRDVSNYDVLSADDRARVLLALLTPTCDRQSELQDLGKENFESKRVADRSIFVSGGVRPASPEEMQHALTQMVRSQSASPCVARAVRRLPLIP